MSIRQVHIHPRPQQFMTTLSLLSYFGRALLRRRLTLCPCFFSAPPKVVSSEVTTAGVKLTMEPAKGGDQTTMDADVVLVATGRRPFTANLGCDELGISLDKMGRIEVDSHFRTAVPSVYAIGDCIAGPMLAHKAEEEGIACVETIAGFAGHVNYDAIPGVVYTHPELAEVRQLSRQGHAQKRPPGLGHSLLVDSTPGIFQSTSVIL